MRKDLWLPTGHQLEEGSSIQSLLFSGNDWQIYTLKDSRNTLLAKPELAIRWCEIGLLSEPMLGTVEYGTLVFKSITCSSNYSLRPVDQARTYRNKENAMAFACSLKESRKLSSDVSFHDAIYVEQYSRLLPTWTISDRTEDEVVLGAWITGGVRISAQSFRRMTKLAGWLSPSDLAEVIQSGGFDVPTDPNSLSRNTFRQQPSTTEANSAELKSSIQEEHDIKEGAVAEPRRFSLPGRPYLEEFFNEHIVDIIFNSERYKALGIEFPSAIVLHGPPGCGKTFAVEKLVEFIDWPSYSIDSNSVGSPYIHETSRKISEVFEKAIDDSPSVLIIDEMESYLSDRQYGGSTGQHHVEEVAEFLRRIPEAIKSNVLIVAMTNMIDRIDPAILRRGRFDHIIEVGMPSEIEVESLLTALLSKVPTSKELKLNKVVEFLTGRALSDSAFVVRESARLAAKEGKGEIAQESINAALDSLPKEKQKRKPIGFITE